MHVKLGGEELNVCYPTFLYLKYFKIIKKNLKLSFKKEVVGKALDNSGSYIRPTFIACVRCPRHWGGHRALSR